MLNLSQPYPNINHGRGCYRKNTLKGKETRKLCKSCLDLDSADGEFKSETEL